MFLATSVDIEDFKFIPVLILTNYRLVVGQSLTLKRVVPVLGVPEALVPLDMPVSQLNLFPG